MLRLIIIEKTVSKNKLNQWIYIPLSRVEEVKVGDEVVVEVWSNNKLIRKSIYRVLEKEICRKTKRGEKCYSYKYIYVQLPWFNVIRGAGGDPRNLRIVVKSVDFIN